MAGEVAFISLAFIAIAGAAYAVTSGNLLRSALALMLSLVGVSGLFLVQEAEFMSAVMLLVYVGGIAVLIIFAVALLEKVGSPLAVSFNRLAPMAILVGVVMSALLVAGTWKAGLAESPPAAISAKAIGVGLLNQWLVPFEALSVLLLAALVGALLVARDGGSE